MKNRLCRIKTRHCRGKFNDYPGTIKKKKRRNETKTTEKHEKSSRDLGHTAKWGNALCSWESQKKGRREQNFLKK